MRIAVGLLLIPDQISLLADIRIKYTLIIPLYCVRQLVAARFLYEVIRYSRDTEGEIKRERERENEREKKKKRERKK
jgi:hypothetical protein